MKPEWKSKRGPALGLDMLSAQTRKAKILYQACEYTTVLRWVPELLSSLSFARECYYGDEQWRVLALSADAHHTASSGLSRQKNNDRSSVSVYGSLLLRGAVAAGKENDRGSVIELLDEATDAAARIGGDHNYQWTAFGPTNVLPHRVNLLVELGDAGSAIDYARKIDPRNIMITERQAALYIDKAWHPHRSQEMSAVC